jgi:hypothetical protein
VSRRQIYDDINFMQSDERLECPSQEIPRRDNAYITATRPPTFSIKIHPLTPTELCMMQRAIFMLNNFKGIPQIDWLNEALIDFQTTFHLKEEIKPVVFLDENPDLAGLQFFTPIYNSILNPHSTQHHIQQQSQRQGVENDDATPLFPETILLPLVCLRSQSRN